MPSMISIVSVALALAAASVSANPVRRATCSPNAQGSGVSIVGANGGSGEWGVISPPTNGAILTSSSFRGLSAPDFHIQQNGQVSAGYVIRDVTNNNLAVTASGNELTFTTASNSGTQANQLWDISCQTCGSNTTPGQNAGSSCTISPHGSDNLCVELLSPLRISACSGNADQLYNIVF